MARLTASVEFHRDADAVCTLRVHVPDAGPGGAYDWACTAVMVGAVARLHGAPHAPRPAQWRALAGALRAHGIERVTWERRTARGARQVSIDLGPAHGEPSPPAE